MSSTRDRDFLAPRAEARRPLGHRTRRVGRCAHATVPGHLDAADLRRRRCAAGRTRLASVGRHGAGYRGIVQDYLLAGNGEGLSTTGLRRRAFSPKVASLLPGLLAATRTGLPPAGDDELAIEDQRPSWSTSTLLGARNQLGEAFEPGHGGVPQRARMPPIRPARSTVDLTTC